MQTRSVATPRFSSTIVFVTGKEWKHLRKNFLREQSTLLQEASAGDAWVMGPAVAVRKIKQGSAGGVVFRVSEERRGKPLHTQMASVFHINPSLFQQGHVFQSILAGQAQQVGSFKGGLVVKGFQDPDAQALEGSHRVFSHVVSTLQNFMQALTTFSPKPEALLQVKSAKKPNHPNNRAVKLAYLGGQSDTSASSSGKDMWFVHLATRDGGDIVSEKAVRQIYDIQLAPEDSLVFQENRQERGVFPLLYRGLRNKQPLHHKRMARLENQKDKPHES